MKFKWTVFLVLTCMVFLQGCATCKGAAEGFKKDVENLDGVDAWIQKNLW